MRSVICMDKRLNLNTITSVTEFTSMYCSLNFRLWLKPSSHAAIVREHASRKNAQKDQRGKDGWQQYS